MKRTQLLALSVLSLGLGVAQASPFPSDAEAIFTHANAGSSAEQQAGKWSNVPFPSDAEAPYVLAASETHAERQAKGMSASRGFAAPQILAYLGSRIDD